MTLFANQRQALKVRLVLWGALIACAFALYGGWTIFETFGLSPGDGGELRPFAQRLAFGGGVAALGLIFAGGMILYASLYVMHMAREGDRVTIETMSVAGTREQAFDASAFAGGRSYKGQVPITPFAPGVNAPWVTLRVAGRRLSFILDVQAEVIEREAIRQLMGALDGED